MQKDGAGAETTIDHRDVESQIRFANERRAKKGLPPLPIPGRQKQQGEVMTNEQVEKLGSDKRVLTPHGPAVVDSREASHDGWMVRCERDGLLRLYHAWDMQPMPKPQAEPAAKK